MTALAGPAPLLGVWHGPGTGPTPARRWDGQDVPLRDTRPSGWIMLMTWR